MVPTTLNSGPIINNQSEWRQTMTTFAIPVNSSAISVVRYDSGSELLEIGFRNGNFYAYYDVDYATFTGLVSAESVGQYFADNIRNHFTYEETEAFTVLNPIGHFFNSAALSAGAYDYDTGVAALVFRSGRIYHYNLHPAAWSDLVRSASPGNYFTNHIRGRAELAS